MSMVKAVELVYSPQRGLVLDLYPAAHDPVAAPVVLYVHGGGFQRGSRKDHEGRLQRLAALGLTVASLDYRLSPEWGYPAPIQDIGDAVAFLRSEAQSLGISAGAVGVLGASAGGYLAVMAALAERRHPQRGLQAVCAWFAPLDLPESIRRSPLEQAVLPPSAVEVFLQSEPAIAASPAHADLRDAPPLLLMHGDSDKIVPPSQSERMHAAMAAHQADSTLIRIAEAGHEDPAFDTAPTLSMVAGWFLSHLSRTDQDSL